MSQGGLRVWDTCSLMAHFMYNIVLSIMMTHTREKSKYHKVGMGWWHVNFGMENSLPLLPRTLMPKTNSNMKHGFHLDLNTWADGTSFLSSFDYILQLCKKSPEYIMGFQNLPCRDIPGAIHLRWSNSVECTNCWTVAQRLIYRSCIRVDSCDVDINRSGGKIVFLKHLSLHQG